MGSAAPPACAAPCAVAGAQRREGEGRKGGGGGGASVGRSSRSELELEQPTVNTGCCSRHGRPFFDSKIQLTSAKMRHKYANVYQQRENIQNNKRGNKCKNTIQKNFSCYERHKKKTCCNLLKRHISSLSHPSLGDWYIPVLHFWVY